MGQQGATPCDMAICNAGGCDQSNAGPNAECAAGGCNQDRTGPKPNCDGGGCSQRGTKNPQCDGGNCCWEGNAGGSCEAGGCNNTAAVCSKWEYTSEDDTPAEEPAATDERSTASGARTVFPVVGMVAATATTAAYVVAAL